MLTLKVGERKEGGESAHTLRRGGLVPAVVYGPRQKPVAITLSDKEFDKIFREAGESTVVTLTGLESDIPTLIHEVEFDPLTNHPQHVDFYAIIKGQKVEIKIPIEFVGESPAVKGGANLVKVLHEIEIEADPMNLPKEFVVDISRLVVVGDQIHVRDIALPADVELKTPADEVVALTQEVIEEKEEAPAAVDLDAIEVEKKGKDETATPEAEGGKEESVERTK